MKKIITLLLVLNLISCGVVKRFKDRRSENHKTTIEADSTIRSTDKSVTTILEKIDTLISIKKDSVILVRPLKEILDGKSIQATDGINTVSVIYDQKTGNIKAVGTTEARKVPVKFSRETKIENNLQTDQHHVVRTKNKSTLTTDKKSVDKKKTGGFSWGVLIGVLGIVSVIIWLFWLEKKQK